MKLGTADDLSERFTELSVNDWLCGDGYGVVCIRVEGADIVAVHSPVVEPVIFDRCSWDVVHAVEIAAEFERESGHPSSLLLGTHRNDRPVLSCINDCYNFSINTIKSQYMLP